MNDEFVNINDLILWLKLQKYGYFLKDKITWVNYGDLNDEFPYNEDEKQWELSRNRMIDKTISVLKHCNVSKLVEDYKEVK